MPARVSLVVFWGALLFIGWMFRLPGRPFKRDLEFSNTLKGLAMLMILYHHSGIYHSKSLWFFFGSGWGFAGVSLFLFISGFGLARSQAVSKLGTMPFLTRRWLAIGPTVAICMAARYALNPLVTIHFGFPTTLTGILGLREWYILALYFWYIVFILLYPRLFTEDIIFGFIMVALVVWALLDHLSCDWNAARLWGRFPVSFSIGVIAGTYAETCFNYIQTRLIPVTLVSLTVAVLSCVLGVSSAVRSLMLDLAVIPFGVCAVLWIYRLNLNSKFLLFMGQHSLPLYLLQVPLIKYGTLMKTWRNDVVGLLATWAVIFMGAWAVIRIRRLIDAGVGKLARSLSVPGQ